MKMRTKSDKLTDWINTIGNVAKLGIEVYYSNVVKRGLAMAECRQIGKKLESFKIVIASHYWNNLREEIKREVILHELAHIVVWAATNKFQQHTDLWKSVCAKLNIPARTSIPLAIDGIEIKRQTE